MKKLLTLLFILLHISLIAQVGIGTNDPKGALDITTTNNTGLVLPRVTDVESVTDGQGNPPVDGTTVFDLSRNTTCFYQDSQWICINLDNQGNATLTNESIFDTFDENSTSIYAKSSNPNVDDFFGFETDLSDDGNTMAVTATYESSMATGINGNQVDNTATESGAVYIFTKTAAVWSQQAYIKASNTDASDQFGVSISLSDDGNTLAVGASTEDSNATGINGIQTDNSATDSGAVYLFSRTGTIWSQEAYIKASNTNDNDFFGFSVSLSGDGNTLGVGAYIEGSNATGINGNENDNSAAAAGAVYIFIKTGITWSQQVYIKASNTEAVDLFGISLGLSNDGNTLAVGAYTENSNAVGIDGNQNNNSSSQSGAVYIYDRTGITWSQQAYIKASNTDDSDFFGRFLSLSGNGNTLAVVSQSEDSNATGINGDQNDNSSPTSGAVYVFIRTGITWNQEAYIKASNTETNDRFGSSLALSNNGNVLVVGAYIEDSNATGINGDQNDNSSLNSGAAYVYSRYGNSWQYRSYIKATNTENYDNFGFSLAISGDGSTLAVGATREDSNATGINGDQTDNSNSRSGAVYIYNTN